MIKIYSAFSFVLFLMLCACAKEQPKIWDNPLVNLEEVGDCKGFGMKSESDYPSDTDCLIFEYDGDSILTISHINAGFNCCPERFMVDVEIRNDTIFVLESEGEGVCDCDCLYDMNYTIQPVPPGEYIITVDEPYVRQAEEAKLEGHISLTEENTGEICVSRGHYPWGT
ncbi:MAG: hypothetical protein HN352_06590 [Bacteroidetes bacterium]|nr:hypothetical protein [Bacteroidota bacterium]MBT4402141.1 hypothetical protein [Bacteroidota bacterium]MBT4409764.1 hypothetical protein [Bacteroidota bacterium]MBT7093712.1 hypothetical protein [Bacteroidota bacterium]